MLKKLLLSLLTLSLFAQVSFEDSLKKILELKNAGDIRGALEELTWVQQELNKSNLEKISSFVPEKVLDYAGGKIENNSALGIVTIERQYKNADSEIKLSLITSSGGEGLGGLAAFAGMAAGMGGQIPGMDNIRLRHGKAVVDTTNGNPKGIVTVGSVTINVEGVSNITKEKLVGFIQALNLEGLSTYIK